MATKVAVYGIFRSHAAVENAVEALQNSGFSSDDVSVLYSSSNQEFAHENTTKSPESAVTGAVSGAAIGGVLGWLAGVGTLAIPGVGPLIAAGPIMATLAGLGIGGTAGGLGGALIGLGIPEYEAKRYASSINEGGMLISVHASDSEHEKRAKEVLKRTGAEDISSKDEEAGVSRSRSSNEDRRTTV